MLFLMQMLASASTPEGSAVGSLSNAGSWVCVQGGGGGGGYQNPHHTALGHKYCLGVWQVDGFILLLHPFFKSIGEDSTNILLWNTKRYTSL